MTCEQFRELTTRREIPTNSEILAVFKHQRDCAECMTFLWDQHNANVATMSEQELHEWLAMGAGLGQRAIDAMDHDEELQC